MTVRQPLRLRVIFSICAVLALGNFLSSCTTYYYVVRHAEKRNNSDSSTLKPEGSQRAIDLRDYLVNKNIGGIYASIYPRTQLTAQPLADALHQTILLYNPDTTQLFATRLKRLTGSKNLVVGHSTNIPVIVRTLSNETIAPIDENDFDNIFTIKVVRQLFWTSRYLTEGTYGAPSPPVP